LIVNYRDKRTRAFSEGKRINAFSGIERAARLKLDRLEAASVLKDLAILPGNRFEALSGDRDGQYSIRINDRWRICFEWPDRQLDVPTNRITAILNGQRSITGDTALRLAHFFGTTAEFWLNLQGIHDLRKAQQKLGSSLRTLPRLKHSDRVPV
jgi:proteic killer suppression protein